MKSILSLPDLDEEDRVEAVFSVSRDESFTRAEMDAAIAEAVEAAKAQAHAEGFKAGEAAMLQSAEAKRAEFLEALAPKLEDLFNEHSEYCAALEQEMTLFMRDFCEKLFPDLVSILGRDRVAAELVDISRRAMGSQWLEVRVPSGYGFLAQEFARPKDAKIELKVIEDPKLRPVAVEANWENGRSEYNFDNLCGDILLLLKNPKPDPKSSGKRL
ncbi:MAG: hypothetical protein GYB24_05240 [Rhodobacteraceae bacterium]|nr:hypothetical protein [Paracoccaceae bacterium]